MDSNAASPGRPASLSRFACDSCREKKIKCSRELPKCAACRPWPGPCVHSRGAQPSKPCTFVAVKDGASPAAQDETDRVSQRLQRIEEVLERLTLSVNKALTASASRSDSSTPAANNTDALSPPRRVQGDDADKPSLFIGESHSFASLEQASQDLKAMQGLTLSSSEHGEASMGLQDLSSSLRTAKVAYTRAGDVTATPAGFFIPSKSLGYGLLSRVLYGLELADIMTTKPPDELLTAAIFAPESVRQPGWVVYVNFMMLAFALNDSTLSHLIEAFRNNTRLSLNNATFFLEPKEANVHALIVLSCHGEEFASPNLSWMFVGHACRQAQALGLHLSDCHGSEDQQRSLALFWSLFIIDKSCSLAFGRPTFLPADIYRTVPSPEFQHLLRYHPHRAQSQSHDTSDSDFISTFGAHFFSQSIKFAKLTGLILDSLASEDSTAHIEHHISELQAWDSQTNQILTEARDAEQPHANEQQLSEMALGIQTMRFQYSHVVILLAKGESHSDIRLQSAREAIRLLPDLVSSYAQVYNGIVWQLLYYPFTPFFTIFRHVCRNPSDSTTKSDVELLSTTASYFQSMKSELNFLSMVSSRLEQTANLFLTLARLITSGALPTAQANVGAMSVATDNESTNIWTTPGFSTPLDVPSDYGAFAQGFTSYIQQQGQLDESFQDMDIENMLQCLPMDFDPEGPRGQKRRFDDTFDWFSWDTYYPEHGV